MNGPPTKLAQPATPGRQECAAIRRRPKQRWAGRCAVALVKPVGPVAVAFGDRPPRLVTLLDSRDLRSSLGTWAAPVAPVRERPVGGDDQPGPRRVAAPVRMRSASVAPARPVDLKKVLGWRHDLLDRLAGKRGQSHHSIFAVKVARATATSPPGSTA